MARMMVKRKQWRSKRKKVHKAMHEYFAVLIATCCLIISVLGMGEVS
jgi:hypothetical protein